jgi:transposase-like protein
VITRGEIGERRRRWPVAEKRDIAAESLESGGSPITVVRASAVVAEWLVAAVVILAG